MNESLSDLRVIAFLRDLHEAKCKRENASEEIREKLKSLDEENPLNEMPDEQFRELLRLCAQAETFVQDRFVTKTSIQMRWWLQVLDGEMPLEGFLDRLGAGGLWDWQDLAVGLQMPALMVCCYMRMRRDVGLALLSATSTN